VSIYTDEATVATILPKIEGRKYDYILATKQITAFHSRLVGIPASYLEGLGSMTIYKSSILTEVLRALSQSLKANKRIAFKLDYDSSFPYTVLFVSHFIIRHYIV
jgi:hypothetical protein